MADSEREHEPTRVPRETAPGGGIEDSSPKAALVAFGLVCVVMVLLVVVGAIGRLFD